MTSEEKFNKLKELYTKLKDQHVALLRQVYYITYKKIRQLNNYFKIKEADVRKQQLSLQETCEHANKVKKELEKRLEEAVEEKTKCETIIQTKTAELQSLKTENEKSQASFIASNQVRFKLNFNLNLIN